MILSVLAFSFGGCAADTSDVSEGQTEEALTNTSWKMFDNIRFRNDPDLSCVLSNQLMFLTPGGLFESGTVVASAKGPDPELLQRRIDDIVRRRPAYVIVDIESWRGPPPERELRQYDADRFKATLGALRRGVRARGDTKTLFAVYGAPYMLRAYAGRTAAAHTLADAQDFQAPSLYVARYSMFANPAEWVSHADAVLATTRAIAPGQPVLPYVWPQLHDLPSGYPGWEHSREFVPSELWRAVLETVHSKADGALVWGTRQPGTRSDERAIFSPNQAWWRVTKDFAATQLHASVAACP